MKRKYILLVFVVLFFMPGPFSFAQRWLTHHYTALNGLPRSLTHDMVQDYSGRMWFATRGGIVSYDGVSWERYGVSDGLPAYEFKNITVDRGGNDGRVWAVAQGGPARFNVLFFDAGRWHTFVSAVPSPYKKTRIVSFHVITEPGGHLPVILVGTLDEGVYRCENGIWKHFTTRNGLAGNRVNGTAVLDKRIYVATNNGLSVINEDLTIDNHLNEILELPTREIKGICVEFKEKYPDYPLKYNRVWLYGHRWLLYFGAAGKNAHVYKPLNTLFTVGQNFVRLQPDYRSGLYVGNRYELYYFDFRTRRAEVVSLANGMVGKGSNNMFIDFEKTVWVAGDRGVTKIAARQFTSLQAKHGLLEDEVSAILEYEPGKFVLGHNDGFTFYDYQSGKIQKLPIIDNSQRGLAMCRVLDMQVDSRKNIWAAMGRSGVAKITPKREVQWFRQGAVPDNAVSLWVEPGDKLWIASDQGLFRLEGGRFIPVPVGSFPHPPMKRLFGDSKRLRYLAGHNTGIFVHDEKNSRWKNYKIPEHKNVNSAYAIHRDNKNRLLIGTLTGLYILEKETVKKFKQGVFEINRPVYFILEDRKKRLWVGTDNGVIRWDGSSAVQYSVPEGLIGLETNRAAGIVAGSGKLWIGTNRGVSIYDEVFDSHYSRVPPPKLHLLYLEAGGRKIPLGRPVELSYKNHTLLFHFRAISFLDEKALLFQEKLTGFTDEWSGQYYPYKQIIRYNNLLPGTYRFHLKAKNALGIWSETVTSPAVTILSPFYKQWWFIFLLAAATLVMGYGLLRFIAQKRNASLLEKLVEERTGQLKASEKKYRTLFEESRDMIFTTTPDGKFGDINPAGVTLLGYNSKEEALKIDLQPEFYYSGPRLEAFQKEIKENGYVKNFEMELKRKDGGKVIALVTATAGPGEQGDFPGVRGIIRDITEQKKLQQQLEQSQKMEAIGTLAGGIAHDFNNILSVITGYVELSLDDLPEGTQVRRNIDQLLIASNRAKELVNRILTFSRRSAQERKPLKVALIVDEALKLLRSTLPTTIEIRKDITGEAGTVVADATQIQQVVMNLCTNAAHAMGQYGGLLAVGVRQLHLDEISAAAFDHIEPGTYLELTVSDTGHGIEPDIMKRIFEPYFTTKKKGEGTGMGLAVIHGIVKSHGGDVTVYSEPGKRTTFHVLLPTAQVPGGTGENGEDDTIPTGNNEHIFLVDDEKSLVEVNTRIMEKLGYRITGNTDSLDALEVFRADPQAFDLVISDLTMPHLTGVQLTEELKNIRPDIPVILCTGFTENFTAGELKHLGIHTLLVKPVTRAGLAKAIRQALN
ncbi:MAG: response regulator [bacterium]|nr:response regulator [bacterium]